MERAGGGAAAADLVKQFNELGKSPVEASQKLDDQYHYLTASVHEQIKALEEQGKHIEAVKVAQSAFAESMQSKSAQMVEHLGYVAWAWRGIKDAVMGAASRLPTSGATKQIRKNWRTPWQSVRNCCRARRGLNNPGVCRVWLSMWQKEYDDVNKVVDALQKRENVAKSAAKTQADNVAAQDAAKKAIDAVTKVQDQGLTKTQQMNAALGEVQQGILTTFARPTLRPLCSIRQNQARRRRDP